MENIASFRELITLPVFYLGIVYFGAFIGILCIAIGVNYSFNLLNNNNGVRELKIAGTLIKIDVFLAISIAIQVIAVVIFAIGIYISRNIYIPFF